MLATQGPDVSNTGAGCDVGATYFIIAAALTDLALPIHDDRKSGHARRALACGRQKLLHTLDDGPPLEVGIVLPHQRLVLTLTALV